MGLVCARVARATNTIYIYIYYPRVAEEKSLGRFNISFYERIRLGKTTNRSLLISYRVPNSPRWLSLYPQRLVRDAPLSTMGGFLQYMYIFQEPDSYLLLR